jgi:hypothetical protein
MGNREVICANTNLWIKSQTSFQAVITSLPDANEIGMDIHSWKDWFVEMVKTIVNLTKNGYAIFYQTDRRVDGILIDKSYLASKGAEMAGANTIFHKIMLRRDVGKVDFFRPTYTHLICFSKDKKAGRAIPDVINRGRMIYDNAMGLSACKMAVEFIKLNSQAKVICDPFCGSGSILAVANKYGFDAIGVDISQDQCKKSRKIKIL